MTPKQGDFANDQIVNIKGGFDWANVAQGQTEVWNANGPFERSVYMNAQGQTEVCLLINFLTFISNC